ncbi:MAG TPA: DUF5996 family protein, partial [Candidatus Limnocylindrales bacterium]|nr:DUF5996 family protein [Candidatus Limnocylindrales bacterium]
MLNSCEYASSITQSATFGDRPPWVGARRLEKRDVVRSKLPQPVEVVESIPFDEDYTHTTYEREHVEAFHRALVQAYRLLAGFQATFLGKVSPPHFGTPAEVAEAIVFLASPA